MNQKDYTVEQLIHNPSFRRIVHGTCNAEEIEKWNSWIESDYDNREKARKAIGEISGFALRSSQVPDVDNEWDRLQSSIQKKRDSREARYTAGKSATKWIYRVAAILLLASLIGAGVHYLSTPNDLEKVEQITAFRTIETGPQERKTLEFSDGSKINLNSNTRLTYESESYGRGTMNIVLDGEAFFESGDNNSTDDPSFVVETPDGIITDIGTSFLVRVHNDQSEVILEEGRVHIKQTNIQDTTNVLQLKKGELISFNSSKVLDRKIVNTTFYTSWATGFLKFNDTSLTSFARYVEERFDVDVQISDQVLADTNIDGGIYFNSLAELVRSVSKVLQFQAYQSKDKQIVYFDNR